MNLPQIGFVDIQELSPDLTAKYEKLQALLREMGRVIVAYSGGVDSALVAKVTHDTLADGDALAVMAISESLSASEADDALAMLDELGIAYETVRTQEVHDPRYAENPANRCYFCKTHLGDALLDLAEARGFPFIVDGFNADDVGDHRPGRQAGRERGVRSPLREAGLTKTDIRQLARHLGLRNWAKPALACLSSRVPYGTAITPEALRQIDQAEGVLRALGLSQWRVRHHDTLARIEVPLADFPALLEHRERVVKDLKTLGYIYVTLDLQGFRSGSMNEALTRRD